MRSSSIVKVTTLHIPECQRPLKFPKSPLMLLNKSVHIIWVNIVLFCIFQVHVFYLQTQLFCSMLNSLARHELLLPFRPFRHRVLEQLSTLNTRFFIMYTLVIVIFTVEDGTKSGCQTKAYSWMYLCTCYVETSYIAGERLASTWMNTCNNFSLLWDGFHGLNELLDVSHIELRPTS